MGNRLKNWVFRDWDDVYQRNSSCHKYNMRVIDKHKTNWNLSQARKCFCWRNMVFCYKLDLKKKKKTWKRAWNMDKISIFDCNVENVPRVEEYSVCKLTIRITSCKAETTRLTSFLYLCCSRRKLYFFSLDFYLFHLPT